MHPFRTREETYDASIVLDASTVGETTVTVAAYTTRRQELSILDSLYRHGNYVGLQPFINKATDCDFSNDARFERLERIIRTNSRFLRAVSHNTHVNGNTDTHQIEAIHSSILVDDLLRTRDSRPSRSDIPDPVTIVDGGEQALEPLLYALEGIRDEEVPVTNCVKAELYYPTVLLADLTANYLAHTIHEGTYDYETPLLSAPVAKSVYPNCWNSSIEGLKRRRGTFTPVTLEQRRGETARERVCCWYDGAVTPGRGAERPLTDSVKRVVQCVTEEGYERVATNISKL